MLNGRYSAEQEAMAALDHPSLGTHDISGIEHATDDFTDIIEN